MIQDKLYAKILKNTKRTINFMLNENTGLTKDNIFIVLLNKIRSGKLNLSEFLNSLTLALELDGYRTAQIINKHMDKLSNDIIIITCVIGLCSKNPDMLRTSRYLYTELKERVINAVERCDLGVPLELISCKENGKCLKITVFSPGNLCVNNIDIYVDFPEEIPMFCEIIKICSHEMSYPTLHTRPEASQYREASILEMFLDPQAFVKKYILGILSSYN